MSFKPTRKLGGGTAPVTASPNNVQNKAGSPPPVPPSGSTNNSAPGRALSLNAGAPRAVSAPDTKASEWYPISAGNPATPNGPSVDYSGAGPRVSDSGSVSTKDLGFERWTALYEHMHKIAQVFTIENMKTGRLTMAGGGGKGGTLIRGAQVPFKLLRVTLEGERGESTTQEIPYLLQCQEVEFDNGKNRRKGDMQYQFRLIAKKHLRTFGTTSIEEHEEDMKAGIDRGPTATERRSSGGLMRSPSTLTATFIKRKVLNNTSSGFTSKSDVYEISFGGSALEFITAQNALNSDFTKCRFYAENFDNPIIMNPGDLTEFVFKVWDHFFAGLVDMPQLPLNFKPSKDKDGKWKTVDVNLLDVKNSLGFSLGGAFASSTGLGDIIDKATWIDRTITRPANRLNKRVTTPQENEAQRDRLRKRSEAAWKAGLAPRGAPNSLRYTPFPEAANRDINSLLRHQRTGLDLSADHLVWTETHLACVLEMMSPDEKNNFMRIATQVWDEKSVIHSHMPSATGFNGRIVVFDRSLKFNVGHPFGVTVKARSPEFVREQEENGEQKVDVESENPSMNSLDGTEEDAPMITGGSLWMQSERMSFSGWHEAQSEDQWNPFYRQSVSSGNQVALAKRFIVPSYKRTVAKVTVYDKLLQHEASHDDIPEDLRGSNSWTDRDRELLERSLRIEFRLRPDLLGLPAVQDLVLKMGWLNPTQLHFGVRANNKTLKALFGKTEAERNERWSILMPVVCKAIGFSDVFACHRKHDVTDWAVESDGHIDGYAARKETPPGLYESVIGLWISWLDETPYKWEELRVSPELHAAARAAEHPELASRGSTFKVDFLAPRKLYEVLRQFEIPGATSRTAVEKVYKEFEEKFGCSLMSITSIEFFEASSTLFKASIDPRLQIRSKKLEQDLHALSTVGTFAKDPRTKEELSREDIEQRIKEIEDEISILNRLSMVSSIGAGHYARYEFLRLSDPNFELLISERGLQERERMTRNNRKILENRLKQLKFTAAEKRAALDDFDERTPTRSQYPVPIEPLRLDPVTSKPIVFNPTREELVPIIEEIPPVRQSLQQTAKVYVSDDDFTSDLSPVSHLHDSFEEVSASVQEEFDRKLREAQGVDDLFVNQGISTERIGRKRQDGHSAGSRPLGEEDLVLDMEAVKEKHGHHYSTSSSSDNLFDYQEDSGFAPLDDYEGPDISAHRINPAAVVVTGRRR